MEYGILFSNFLCLFILDDINPKSIVLEGYSSLVNSVTIQDNKVVSGSCDQTVRVWDLEDSKAEPIVLDGHSDYVNSIAIQGSTLVWVK